MKRLITAIGAILVLALALPSATHAGMQPGKKSAFPVTIVDDLNNRVTLTKQPKRIVSLDPRDTESLFALGLEKRVVADGFHGAGGEGAAGINRPFKYPSEWPSPWGRDYPTRSKRLPQITGGCCNVPWNIESVVNIRPDVIFSLNSDSPTLKKMRDLGLKVVILDPANFQGILHDLNLMAKATGSTKHAVVVTRVMKKILNSTRRRLSSRHNRPRTYYELDASNPTQPYTAGQGTFIDEAIRLAGGKNVTDGISPTGTPCPGKDCYFALSLEALIKLNPQVVVLGDAAYGTTVQSVKARQGWETISGVKNGKIYPFNDELISRAGPRIVIGIKDLSLLIHPR
jgi:iron complex transport system substrate-binding protein